MRYQKQKPYRLKRYFIGIQDTNNSHWYNEDLKKWEHESQAQFGKYSYSNRFKPCRTVRAFKRHIRKHPYMKGKLKLVNKYMGFEVYG